MTNAIAVNQETHIIASAYRFEWANQWCHADASGALFIEEPKLLIVSDLHLEKASHYSAKGRFLPPYDSEKTLRKLQNVVQTFKPKTVLSLGDAFHDNEGRNRLSDNCIKLLDEISKITEFIWVIGNHDAGELKHNSMQSHTEIERAGIRFIHEADTSMSAEDGFEVSGHFHPCATIIQRGRRLRRRCFAMDQKRMIMPAFGSLTGNLNISDPIYTPLFQKAEMSVILLGERSAHHIPRALCSAGR